MLADGVRHSGLPAAGSLDVVVPGDLADGHHNAVVDTEGVAAAGPGIVGPPLA